MKLIHVFALVLLALLGSCRQDPTTGTTTVSGQVVDQARRQPVPNAHVQVYHASSGGGYAPVGSPYPADAQGRFSFQFDATNQTGYILLADAPPGYFTPFYAGPSLTAGRRNDNLLIAMLAPAWVKLQLVDEPPKSRAVINLWGYEGNGDVLYYPRDTTLIRPVLGGYTGNIMWEINNTGIFVQHSQSVQVPALDTVMVRIPF